MRHLQVDAPNKKCSCDAFGDGPCPVHAEECRLQNERLRQEAEELKKTGVRCYVIGRLNYVIPHGSKTGSFVLSYVFTSSRDALNQRTIPLTGETFVNILQTDPHLDYPSAMKSAKETYFKCFPELSMDLGIESSFG